MTISGHDAYFFPQTSLAGIAMVAAGQKWDLHDSKLILVLYKCPVPLTPDPSR